MKYRRITPRIMRSKLLQIPDAILPGTYELALSCGHTRTLRPRGELPRYCICFQCEQVANAPMPDSVSPIKTTGEPTERPE